MSTEKFTVIPENTEDAELATKDVAMENPETGESLLEKFKIDPQYFGFKNIFKEESTNVNAGNCCNYCNCCNSDVFCFVFEFVLNFTNSY